MSTKAPETIWAVFEPHPNPKDKTPYVHASASETKGVPYVLRDHAQALVAAEREACFDVCVGEYLEDEPETEEDKAYDRAVADCLSAIRQRTPDAAAALEKVKREARIEGMRQAAEVIRDRTRNTLNGLSDFEAEITCKAIATLIDEEKANE